MRLQQVVILAGLTTGIMSSQSIAQAGFLGDDFTFQYYSYGGSYSAYGSPNTFVADGAIDGTFGPGPYFSYSVGDNKITFNYLNDVTYSPSSTSLNQDGLYIDNGALFTDNTGAAAAIKNVTIDSSSMLGSSGFSASNLTFNSKSVATSWMNLSFHEGDSIVLDVSFAPSPVPLPASAPMFGAALLALAGFGYVAKRKKSAEA